ncbi:MAG TPA: glycosyltransferase family 4 protein [Patescibacteria group bacterium]|nr:glycosyltransferase family 4 protein [Patescibacteria group bacterium]
MKILQITPRIPFPLHDGGAICMYNTTKFLSKAGHSVTFAALNTNKHFVDPAVMSDVCEDIHTTFINTDISAVAAFKNLFTRLPYNAERFISADFSALLESLLKKERFDVINIESIFVAYYIDVIRRFSKAPIVLRAHNAEYMITERLAKNEKNLLKSGYLHFLSRRMKRFEAGLFKKFDGILAITPDDAAIIESMGYNGPIAVMPAGVDTKFFSPDPKEDFSKKKMFFFASLEWVPNIEALQWFMREVFSKIQKLHPDLEFHYGGKSPDERSLVFKNTPGVHFHPNIASAPDFMRAHGIQLVPLLSGGGMRVKIIEAMSAGKVIISTNIGAEGIRCKHDENILIADTADEFIMQLDRCFKNPDVVQRISRNARETAVQYYSWEEQTEVALALYHDLLKNNNTIT